MDDNTDLSASPPGRAPAAAHPKEVDVASASNLDQFQAHSYDISLVLDLEQQRANGYIKIIMERRVKGDPDSEKVMVLDSHHLDIHRVTGRELDRVRSHLVDENVSLITSCCRLWSCAERGG
eukprot:gb/GECG01015906.1/.p1 GENE.gb/GECG01015906.1/~~gb/GECG01015906.1/.p1  ORF type:complete len:122 (+),score=12.01 gb/GECG01015906.1/:1-366(+)